MTEICCDPCEMVLSGNMDLCGGAECPEHPDYVSDSFGGGWNYRVIKRKYGIGCTIYAIHEVYYTEDGVPHSCTTESVHPIGEDASELKRALLMYTQAFDRPVLDYDTFTNLRKGSHDTV